MQHNSQEQEEEDDSASRRRDNNTTPKNEWKQHPPQGKDGGSEGNTTHAEEGEINTTQRRAKQTTRGRRRKRGKQHHTPGGENTKLKTTKKHFFRVLFVCIFFVFPIFVKLVGWTGSLNTVEYLNICTFEYLTFVVRFLNFFSRAREIQKMLNKYRFCPQPNPGSQLFDGKTSKPQHETCTSNPGKLSHQP